MLDKISVDRVGRDKKMFQEYHFCIQTTNLGKEEIKKRTGKPCVFIKTDVFKDAICRISFSAGSMRR